MNLLELNQRLMQKPPFQMVDRVTECRANEYIKGLKNLTMNESFFQGHFPGFPIMPGVFMIEALAQLSSLVVEGTGDSAGKIPVMVKVDEMKFLKPVIPGDSLILESWVESLLPGFYKFRVQGSVEGVKAVAGRLSFSLVDSAQLFPVTPA